MKNRHNLLIGLLCAEASILGPWNPFRVGILAVLAGMNLAGFIIKNLEEVKVTRK